MFTLHEFQTMQHNSLRLVFHNNRGRIGKHADFRTGAWHQQVKTEKIQWIAAYQRHLN